MLTLRGWAMLLAIGALVQPVAAAEPDHVTYVLGGVMSGPSRLEGDLVSGAFLEAQPPPGEFGDGAGLDARTMPVTRQWIVPPEKLAVLRRLAASVWRHGMEKIYVRRTVCCDRNLARRSSLYPSSASLRWMPWAA
jgi:hypothetical protein